MNFFKPTYFNYFINYSRLIPNRKIHESMRQQFKQLTYPKKELITYNVDLSHKILEQESIINTLKMELDQLREIINNLQKMMAAKRLD